MFILYGVLHDVARDWVSDTNQVLVCGIAGVPGKWRETGYRSCPAGLRDLTPIALDDADAAIAIFPGVALARQMIQADVMHGEETQVLGPSGLRAIRAVLPADLQIYAVGGVSPDNLADWQRAGAAGFGIGSAIFKPGQDARETGLKATNFVAALDGGER